MKIERGNCMLIKGLWVGAKRIRIIHSFLEKQPFLPEKNQFELNLQITAQERVHYQRAGRVCARGLEDHRAAVPIVTKERGPMMQSALGTLLPFGFLPKLLFSNALGRSSQTRRIAQS